MRVTLSGLRRAAALLIICGLAACSGGDDAARYTTGDMPTAQDWPANGRDAGQTRFSPLEQINAGNVGRLGLAWEFDDFIVRGRTHHGMESNPILHDGALYLSGPWGTAYAVDATSGKLLWKFDPALDHLDGRMACCDVVNRGLAIAGDKVFVGAFDGILHALDLKTGKEVWQADTFPDRRWNLSITSAPFIAGNKVMIGNAGSDMGARGHVSAYDIDTGKLAWRFWAVPGDPTAGPDENPDVTKARETWPEDTRWELGMGGNPWDNLGYDPETNTAFLALGNGGPQPAWLRSKSGALTDQLYLSSIVAVDADTGRMKWYYQTTPHDSWDYAATSHMILADLEIDGKVRKVLMQAPKNGVFYVLDRETGELLRANPFTTVNWTSGVDLKTGRPVFSPDAIYKDEPQIVFPSAAGGHAWQPMSYSPRTQLVYFPVYDAPMKYQALLPARFVRGARNAAAGGKFPPYESRNDKDSLARQGLTPVFEARLKAWDPKTGKAAWQSDPLPFVSGGTLVSGDLVFQGTGAGYLTAYDAATGKRLLNLFVGTNIMAAPITYSIDGVQYVAVTAGAGGAQAARFVPGTAAADYENFERLLVFKLDGASVPIPPKRMPAVDQPVPKAIAASSATTERGRSLFEYNCARCHVMGGATGIYPDLWNMPPEAIDGFKAIVYDGAYASVGMGKFSDVLTQDEVAAIKAFVVNDTIKKKTKGAQAAAHSDLTSH